MTVEDWQRRHDRYRSEGITDVWLFGGTRYLRARHTGSDATEPEHAALLAWSPLFTAVAAAHRPVLFIDPFGEALGVAYGEVVTGLLATRDPMIASCCLQREPVVWWSPLATCRAAAGRLLPVGVREQFGDATRHRRHFTALAEMQAERARTESGRRQEAEAARVQARIARAASAVDWVAERARWEDEQGVAFPLIVDEDPHPDEDDLGLTGDQWRIAVLRVLSARPGSVVPTRVLLQALEVCCRAPVTRPVWAGSRSATEQLLRTFLCRLRAAGWVAFAGKTGPLAAEGVCALRTLADPPPDGFVQDLASLHIKTRSGVTRVQAVVAGQFVEWRCRRAARLTPDELLAALPAEPAARWQAPAAGFRASDRPGTGSGPVNGKIHSRRG
ncbi:hypothetical protein [Micromonospora sp. NPDC005173]|uniref:hypothetical protein n=1 Tax=Micromonospora sp. NPDC005173 TaxID=3157165 RepID=UPI0033B9C9D5